MIDYYTCKECYRKGRKLIDPEPYPKTRPIAIIECYHCGKNIIQDKDIKRE